MRLGLLGHRPIRFVPFDCNPKVPGPSWWFLGLQSRHSMLDKCLVGQSNIERSDGSGS